MTNPQPAGDAALDGPARWAITIGFALLIVGMAGAIAAAIGGVFAGIAATQSLQVIQTQGALFSRVQDLELGQRGYLLTNDPRYLVLLNRAKEQIPALMDEVSRATLTDAAQHQRFEALRASILRKMQQLRDTMKRQNAGDSGAAMDVAATNEGQDLMDQIRSQAGEIKDLEFQKLNGRQRDVARQRTLLLAVILLVLILVGVLAYVVWKEARRITHTLAERNANLQVEMEQRLDAEARLKQAQKMEALGQLTGGVAHDFNNMLAIIVGSLDMFMRKFPAENPRAREMIENARSGALRAAALTKRLLAFSRQQPLAPQATDVNKCVRNTSEMLRSTLDGTIVIETVLGGGLWPAYVDLPQLENAIVNLAVNARDAMASGGRLTIETSNASLDRAYAAENTEVEPGQYVLIAITDTGTGMTADVQRKAFDPFFTTKQVGAGTGLGLSQVLGFVKQSKGHVKLYSEVGSGTTVKLYFPRATTGETSIAPATSSPLPSQIARLTALVVEDDPAVRNFVVGAMRDTGITVIEAEGKASALAQLESHPEIVLLLTDVVMPHGTGRELADAAKAIRPDLRVIYMTGYTRNAIVHNGTLDPGTRLLTKPFTVDELHHELSRALTDV